MSLQLTTPDHTVKKIVEFLRATFNQNHKTHVVLAASGGIDSSLALALLVQSLPMEQITVLHLPYGQQSTADSQLVCQFLNIPTVQQRTVNIAPIVDAAATLALLGEHDQVRKGNLMARARMMLVYDAAKELNALVCGTENKSEHYLGYYTRFGDAASDIEPIAHLYKTQVRQLATYLCFPDEILQKPPSAGLWNAQTDEDEFGFSYEVADQVLEQFVDLHVQPAQIQLPNVKSSTIQAVIERVRQNRFKFHVPYVME